MTSLKLEQSIYLKNKADSSNNLSVLLTSNYVSDLQVSQQDRHLLSRDIFV